MILADVETRLYDIRFNLWRMVALELKDEVYINPDGLFLPCIVEVIQVRLISGFMPWEKKLTLSPGKKNYVVQNLCA